MPHIPNTAALPVLPQSPPAPAGRPLSGMTVLVVEDSRYASEAVRLLCLRSGARIRRAATLATARRHLSLYRPRVLVVDLGLPDGSGCDLICEARSGPAPLEAVLAMSGDPGLRGNALAAGAGGFLQKPVLSLDLFQRAVLELLPAVAPGPAQAGAGDPVDPDPGTLEEDLAHIDEMLGGAADPRTLDYAAQFAAGLALQCGDTDLYGAAERLRAGGGRPGPAGDLARLSGLVRQRLRERRAG